MDPSSSSPNQLRTRAVPHATSRTTIRRDIHRIVRNLILDRLASRRRLNKAERDHARNQARLIENVLYRSAERLEDYSNARTLESRVFKAGRMVFFNTLRRELMMRRENELQMADGESDGTSSGIADRQRRGRLRRSASF
mmetsp:Transcript_16436/g.39336  ORF Transcript_16436/g.39336 Transcript_16436/m.39336 type:complete len:140 (-) Transcript_16436:101-520(-)|eukprot:CAMPEP_0181113370 /NCGR_PEP_ID=MMETSP1071-20121207/20309_1 /TAXON_ID=35127 /ORGANISM="Thalassiosira sp., Strain NH16" /LENGTH=139 /DNA_ID=CAMNT_0023197399 /DNA_START=216 /DNA_END=635 /DNA_ORIENTATION=-